MGNPQIANGFFSRYRRGTPLCKIPFRKNDEKVFNILETIEGYNGITIIKPTMDGTGWKVVFTGSTGGGIPEGYEEETLNVVTDEGIKTRTVLVKTADKADVLIWDGEDERKLLQIDSDGKLTIDRGYLV